MPEDMKREQAMDSPIWKSLYTKAGVNLLAKLQTGTALHISRVVSGAGHVEPELLFVQGAVSDPRKEFSLGRATYKSDGNARLPTALSNDGIGAGYLLYQIGVYALDPEDGEILYCLMQSESPDYIPTETQLPGFVFKLGINLVFGNADKIDVKIDPTGMVSIEDLEAHNTDPTAHGGLMQRLSPDTSLVTISHNLGRYPRLLVVGSTKFGAGLGGAGENPAGGSDMEELPSKAVWHDRNALTVKTTREIAALGTPELHQTNVAEYTVTFEGNPEDSVYIYLETGQGEPPSGDGLVIANMVFSDTPPQDKTAIWGEIQ